MLMVFFNCRDTTMTAVRTPKAPRLAATLIMTWELLIIKRLPPATDEPSRSSATPRLAPELIPST